MESTVNLVVSRRFAKKQQMQWSKAGAHLLLQTRTQTLDGTLRDLFTTVVSGHGRQRQSSPGSRHGSLIISHSFAMLPTPCAGI